MKENAFFIEFHVSTHLLPRVSDSQSPGMAVEEETMTREPGEQPLSPTMSLWLLVQRGISLPLAKGSESHRGRDGKRNVVDSIKRLSGPPALAGLFMFSKSPLGWIGVVKWVWHIAMRPPHALAGHRGSRIIPGSQAWYRAEQ